MKLPLIAGSLVKLPLIAGSLGETPSNKGVFGKSIQKEGHQNNFHTVVFGIQSGVKYKTLLLRVSK